MFIVLTSMAVAAGVDARGLPDRMDDFVWENGIEAMRGLAKG